MQLIVGQAQNAMMLVMLLWIQPVTSLWQLLYNLHQMAAGSPGHVGAGWPLSILYIALLVALGFVVPVAPAVRPAALGGVAGDARPHQRRIERADQPARGAGHGRGAAGGSRRRRARLRDIQRTGHQPSAAIRGGTPARDRHAADDDQPAAAGAACGGRAQRLAFRPHAQQPDHDVHLHASGFCGDADADRAVALVAAGGPEHQRGDRGSGSAGRRPPSTRRFSRRAPRCSSAK